MSQQIYKATYSGVPVYELSCNGVAVMRRKNDSYMNATQILKVADFDKPQRTRILEREVQVGDHEKIQGGYGKYQGTWVPLERAAHLAKHYNVDNLIQPLLEFVKGEESPPLAPKHVTAASAKPKKQREQRVRKKRRHVDDDISDIIDDSGLTVEDEVSSYARTPSPRRPTRRAAATIASSALESDFDASSENDNDLPSKTTRHSRHKRTKMDDQQDYMDVDIENNSTNNKMTEKAAPSTKSKQPSSKSSRTQSAKVVSNSASSSPTLSSSASSPPSIDRTPLTKHKTKKEVEHERTYAHKLLLHFLSENEEIPSLLQRPPRDLDINVIIDEEGHTCLHWAAVMGRISTVQRLIKLGADVYRVNYKGQTALMRSVLYTNNYEQKTFDQLLDLLSSTTFNIDKSDQTVFHHVATTANGKGKIHASQYYMENLISKLVHSRSELISILNVQDVCGDTALTIASRIGNKKLVRLLIDAGASTEIANEEGMTAQDYLAALDQHLMEKGGSSNSLEGNLSASPTLSLYQSEEMTREQLRQKVDSMYKTMLSGTVTSPSISHWVDDLAASYERDLLQKEHAIREKQKEIQMITKRLEDTDKAMKLLGDDDRQEEIQMVLERGEKLILELRRLLLYTQQVRLGQWIKENENTGMIEKIDQDITMETPSSSSLSSSQHTEVDISAGETTTEDTTVYGPINKPPTPPIIVTGNKSDTRKQDLSSREKIQEDQDILAKKLTQLQQSRQQLMDDIISQRTSIPEKRIQNYKRLISMCCNIAYENVDSMLAPILASFDEAGTLKKKSSPTTS
ncbi:uncharacterized protein BX664DRAFT_360830 [Halteromyces radiatus]|uniref:uncharacterized protein n=1 Tax=Halteromyces radiatus TaxID=101107 RepID=UPI00221F5D9E|nr:uncharacterized protein BX664DRAFT_360830 [Halteromyces radiatus]KAI8085039.1 hypothetical protein BX664DRAFT_360830 [Halteromyces radiatus]